MVNTVQGTTTAQTISVTQLGTPNFRVDVSGYGGIAPTAPRISITKLTPLQVGRVDFDVNNDGTVDASKPDFVDTLTLDLGVQQPSTVPVVIRIYDPNNALLYSKTIWLQALDSATVGYRALSALNEMIDKLLLGNTAGALRYFNPDSQQRYQDVFSALGASVPQVAQQLGTIQQGAFGSTVAEFVLVRPTPSGNRSFPAYLYKTADGVWRLESL